ncbi:Vesicle-associated protein 1-1 [Zea mays]|uniref:Vesicle-associated protein 1-1 n=1 Tax=Zea mays TaxID=4577 RepID=A0A1D6PW16_MAIZE|nr:Vesicle-associated protein 1-1 [Zea mays]
MAAPAPATTGDLLRVDPLELRFPFELKKQISCSMQLSNHTDDYIAFKVKTTSPKKYSVRPNTGVVLPRSTCDVVGLWILALTKVYVFGQAIIHFVVFMYLSVLLQLRCKHSGKPRLTCSARISS